MSENAAPEYSAPQQIEEFEILPPGRINAPRRVDRPPAIKRGKAILSRDIRDTIKAAFYGAGGRRYLEKVAQKRPDVFLNFVAKAIPTETKVSVMASYQGVPVPVEDRDGDPLAIAAPAAANAVRDAVLTAAQDAATPALVDLDADWLGIPDNGQP